MYRLIPALTLMLAACGVDSSNTTEPVEVPIAAVGPYTGPIADTMLTVQASLGLAMIDINAADVGYRFEVVPVDDETSNTIGGERTRAAIADGIRHFIGPTVDSFGSEMLKATEEHGLSAVSGSSTGREFTQTRDGSLFVRTSGRADLGGPLVARYLHGLGVKNLGVLTQNNATLRENADAVANAFQEMDCGGQKCVVTRVEPYSPASAPDYTSPSPGALAMQVRGCDAVLLQGTVEDSVALLMALDAVGVNVPINTNVTVIAAPGVLDLLPPAQLPRLTWLNEKQPSGPAREKYDADFAAMAGFNSPGIVQEFSIHDAAAAVALGVVAAGPEADGRAHILKVREIMNPPGAQYGADELVEAMAAVKAGEDIDYQGFMGVDLDELGDVIDPSFEVYGLGPTGPVVVYAE